MSTGVTPYVHLIDPKPTEIKLWDLRGPASAYCDVCGYDTDHNAAAHRAGLHGQPS